MKQGQMISSAVNGKPPISSPHQTHHAIAWGYWEKLRMGMPKNWRAFWLLALK
jgi:hypothetical protein